MIDPAQFRKGARTIPAVPRFITPRSSPYTYGRNIARTALYLGRPAMPWQQETYDLVGECDADGQLLHRVVVITVPRQSGKTAGVLAIGCHRCTMREQARVWYTAQTGIKAREQMTELMETVERSRLAPLFKSRRGASNTSLTLTALGSRLTAHPPTADSLHGNQSDANFVDEGWYFDPDQAHGLMGAITPTQATRPNPQTIIVSTSGTAASTWFHGLVDAGYEGKVALIDYGIAADVDPYDDLAIALAHPAIGYTQDISILPAARAQLSEGEFLRAYGNRRTATLERLVPLEIVELATVTTDLPPGRPIFGLAVSLDRDESVLTASTLDASGVPHVEVVDVLTGTDSAAVRCVEVTARHAAPVMIAADGPAATVADEIERRRGRVSRVSAAEFSAAVTDLLDRLRRPLIDPDQPPAVRLRAHPAFTSALDVAALRRSGDRSTLSRRGSAGSVAALESAACAVRGALDGKSAVPPMIWS